MHTIRSQAEEEPQKTTVRRVPMHEETLKPNQIRLGERTGAMSCVAVEDHSLMEAMIFFPRGGREGGSERASPFTLLFIKL